MLVPDLSGKSAFRWVYHRYYLLDGIVKTLDSADPHN